MLINWSRQDCTYVGVTPEIYVYKMCMDERQFGIVKEEVLLHMGELNFLN